MLFERLFWGDDCLRTHPTASATGLVDSEPLKTWQANR